VLRPHHEHRLALALREPLERQRRQHGPEELQVGGVLGERVGQRRGEALQIGPGDVVGHQQAHDGRRGPLVLGKVAERSHREAAVHVGDRLESHPVQERHHPVEERVKGHLRRSGKLARGVLLALGDVSKLDGMVGHASSWG
jgi:hypothetical protein